MFFGILFSVEFLPVYECTARCDYPFVVFCANQYQKSSNMDNKFRNQLLAESKKKEEELKSVNLEIEERKVSKKGPSASS